MIIALIHWRIRPDEESIAAFLNHWKTVNTVDDRSGLIGEFLSETLPVKEFPYITWNLDPQTLGNSKSFITVGLWGDEAAFHKQIAPKFKDDAPLESFEKYRRRRVVIDPVAHRIGKSQIPQDNSEGVA